MSDLDVVFGLLGEVAHLRTLRRYRVTDRELREAIDRSTLRRLRPGWYATPHADPDQIRAILLHGRIGCASALSRYGVWSGRDRALHVHVPRNAARLHRTPPEVPGSARPVWHPKTPDGLRRGILLADRRPAVRVHWRTDAASDRVLDWIVSPEDALAQAVRCLDPEHAQAAVDTVVSERVLPRPVVERIVADAPARVGLRVDSHSEQVGSGVEALFVRRLLDAGFEVVPQFLFAGHGRFDGLIDGCVLFEVDGWAFHRTQSQFLGDRDRTLVAQSFGVPLVRPAAAQVLDDWPTVLAAVERTVADAKLIRAARGHSSFLG
ncbi:hypothetical protein GE115_14980 [Agromyces sp. CFH 90414]|uniref:DUF559 domain-containing protein n=1 Tax=Agromyces agglutinans TaxID=2662258 RepID=A0A6I2FBG1_9MICO|nr:hypothetical protein [Agromyces agglutinans]MRG61157.1 hypothetical protein [Agromyces agglutinans]